jgi:hypothetical protein
VNDDNVVLVHYIHPNRGDHPVVGPETRIKYGMRSSGDEFLIDHRDLAGAPHLFRLVEKAVQTPTIVNIPAAPTPVPTPVSSGLGWGSLAKGQIKALEGEGFTSLEDLRGMSEAGLLTIKGVTPAAAKKIVADLA